jgi:hypothetical protein
MNAILAKLLGAKGGWKIVLDFLMLMVQAQKLKIPGTEKLNEVITKLQERYVIKEGTWAKLLPLITNAAKAVKELYVGVCEAFGFNK